MERREENLAAFGDAAEEQEPGSKVRTNNGLEIYGDQWILQL